MAVVVQCYQCNAILELDDGFRGGVCRCGTCGTLLQVPKGDAGPGVPRGARPAGPPAPAAAATSIKPQAPSPTSGDVAAPSSGALDASGLSSGLGQVHRTRP